jgi:hypothetical protein
MAGRLVNFIGRLKLAAYFVAFCESWGYTAKSNQYDVADYVHASFSLKKSPNTALPGSKWVREPS